IGNGVSVSWMGLILPFIEQVNEMNQLIRTGNTDDGVKDVTYNCPHDAQVSKLYLGYPPGGSGYGLTSYVAIPGLDYVSYLSNQIGMITSAATPTFPFAPI